MCCPQGRERRCGLATARMLVLLHHATGHGLTRNSTLACSSVYTLEGAHRGIPC